MEQPERPIHLFYSYAHEDEGLRNELEKHLSLLQRRGLITAWHDRQIVPGAEWAQEIDEHLEMASIILLLISADFVASNYCYDKEMKRALERHRMREAQVIPVILRPVDWHEAPFAHLQCLPLNAKPVTEWDNREAALRDIAEGLRRTIEKQRQFHPQDRTGYSVEMSNRLKYLKHLMDRYSTVTLPLGPIEGFTLQAIFQPLTLRRDPLAAEDLQREHRRALLGETIQRDDEPMIFATHNEPVIVANNSEEALQKSPQKRMVILGGPGTGKTTVLQFLIYELAQKTLADPSAPLPIIVSLPDLARSGKTLQEYILHLTREAGVQDQFASTLGKAIEEGQAFICLDSLDEVSPDKRPDMIRTINELAASAGNIWVIGSRFTEYKGGQFKRGQFTEWELQPMTPALRRELAQHLLPELGRLLQPKLDQVEDAPLAFVSLLETHVQAYAWGENPLLFSLAAVVFVRLGMLPSSRSALYQQVIDAVLETREKDPRRRKVLRRVISDLALELYTAKGRTFSLDDLLVLLPIIRQRQHENWATEEIAQRIITSGMLDVLAHETYGFRHQTFQEYLAAVELAQRLVNQDQALRDEAWAFIWSKRTYSRWTEVLRLMVGVLVQNHRREGAQKARAWLSELAGQQHKPEGDPGQLGLALALKSLAEVAETTTPYWKDVGGNRVEEELVAAWVARLFDASQHGYTNQQRQLKNLSTDIVYLEQIVAKVAMERTRAALHDRDAKVRKEAIQELGRLGVCVPAEPLVAALHDKEWSVRAAAAWTLRVLHEKMPVEPLLAALHDTHEEVRRAAIGVLGDLGQDVPLEPLLAALHDTHEEVRRAAIGVLGNLGQDAPSESLVAALDDPAWSVRRAAAEALGKPSVLIPLEQFITIMQDEDPSVRAVVVESLENMGEHAPLEPLLVALGDQDGEVRAMAARALGNFGEQMPIAPLLEALNDEDVWACGAVAESLIKQIELVPVEPLLAIIKRKSKDRYGRDKYELARKAALDVVGSMGERASVNTLLTALNDESELVRYAAIRALGKLKTTTASETLLAILNNEREPASIRAETVTALADLEENIPIAVLLAALNDSSEEVRKAAAESLGKIKTHTPVEALANLEENTAIATLLAALNDSSEEVRKAAAESLGKIKTHTPVEQLLAAASEHIEWIRLAAVPVLGKLGEKAPIDLLLSLINDNNEEYAVRAAAVHAIVELGEYIPLKTMLAVFQHEDARIRQIIVQIFGRHITYSPKNIPAVSLLIALKNEDHEVRQAAVQGLVANEQARRRLSWSWSTEDRGLPNVAAWLRTREKLRTPISSELLEMLVELLSNEDIDTYTTAARALGELGAYIPVELVQKLLAALDDEKPQMRAGASRALTELGNYIPSNCLIEALNHEHWRMREGVVQIMGELKEATFVQPLLAALRDQQPEVRKAAAHVLAEMKEPVPPEPLLAALHDEDMHVRLAVASTLNALAIPFSAESVMEALGHPDITVCLDAVPILAELVEQVPTEPLLAAVHNDDPMVRRQAAWALYRLGERAPIELVMLTLTDEDNEVHSLAVRTWDKVVEHVPMELLQSMLQSEHQQIRQAAIGSLGKWGVHTSWEFLLTALNDEDDSVSWPVRQALSGLEEDIPTKIIEDALNTGTTKVREGIAYILGRRGIKAPATLLLRVMDDSDQHVRFLATLGLAGADEPGELLAKALQSGSPRIRQTVVEAIEKMEDNIPTSLLLIALQDKDSMVRLIAARAIARYAEQVPIESLLACLHAETDDSVPQYIVGVPFASKNDSVLEYIVKALENRILGAQIPIEPVLSLFDRESIWLSPSLRASIIKTLGQFGTRAPRELLLAALGDIEQQVREAAAEALKKTHPEALLAIAPEAISVLQGQKPGAIFGSLAHWFFADAVINMEYASPAIFEKLTQLLDWPSWQVRVKVINAFGKLRRNIPDTAIRRLQQLRFDPQSSAVRKAADEVLAEILSLETGIEDD